MKQSISIQVECLSRLNCNRLLIMNLNEGNKLLSTCESCSCGYFPQPSLCTYLALLIFCDAKINPRQEQEVFTIFNLKEITRDQARRHNVIDGLQYLPRQSALISMYIFKRHPRNMLMQPLFLASFLFLRSDYRLLFRKHPCKRINREMDLKSISLDRRMIK